MIALSTFLFCSNLSESCMSYETITPEQLDARIKRGEALRLIDVREPIEHEIACIAGAELLPLSRFDEWAGALNPEEETVVMCHHGIRSAQVCAFLSRQGFKQLYNLAGGIDRWSQEVDGSVPQY
jgi:rhodanese-related sulfurtransferase